MKIKHKSEYLILVLVSLLLFFALQTTLVTYGVNGEFAYTARWRSSGEVFTSNDLQLIQELKTSIKEKQQYFFFVGEKQEKEFASVASILDEHPLGFNIADAGVVKYLEAKESVVVKFMVSSESNNDTDKVHFSIESLEGNSYYLYEGINESFQKIIDLEPGNYLISWGVVAQKSDFDLTMKMAVDQ
jgi:hypothetical protein